MENSNVLVVAPSVTLSVANLSESRTKLVSGLGKVGELLKGYAMALDQAFDLKDNQGNVTTKWYDLKGKLKAGVKTERANFVADMVKAGYIKEGTTDTPSATVDTYWGRVKEASGYVPSGNRASGGTDTDSKTVAELKTMINRIFKAEESGEDCEASSIKGLLMDAYESLGGDVDALG
jgi:hypothetical protein